MIVVESRADGRDGDTSCRYSPIPKIIRASAGKRTARLRQYHGYSRNEIAIVAPRLPLTFVARALRPGLAPEALRLRAPSYRVSVCVVVGPARPGNPTCGRQAESEDLHRFVRRILM